MAVLLSLLCALPAVVVAAAAGTASRASPNGTAIDPRFAWIATIEHGPAATHLLLPKTYYIDRQYRLPDGTRIVGAGSGPGGTRVVAVPTRPAQTSGHFHGCGLSHVNRQGFVLGSRTYIGKLHYVGFERSRYPDSHPLCGGAPFETPGCATAYCQHSNNSNWTIGGGEGVRDSLVEDVTVAGGGSQDGFFMPQTVSVPCHNITVRNLVVTGNCSRKSVPAQSFSDPSSAGVSRISSERLRRGYRARTVRWRWRNVGGRGAT